MALRFGTTCRKQYQGQCAGDRFGLRRLPPLQLVLNLETWGFLPELQWRTIPHPQIRAMTPRLILPGMFRLFECAGLGLESRVKKHLLQDPLAV